jgi:hypothetical protein
MTDDTKDAVDRRTALKLLALSGTALALPAAADQPDPAVEAAAAWLAGEERLELTPEQQELLREDVAYLRKAVARLREFELAGELEPAFAFRVLESP